MEKIIIVASSILILAGIVFLEFYFIEAELFKYFPNIGVGFHFFGGFFIAVITYYMFLSAMSQLRWYMIVIFLAGAVGLAAIGWEGFEWVLGRITGSFYQASVDNTMEDLFVGLSGGLFACPLVLMRNVFLIQSISAITSNKKSHVISA
jgi:hypothetical protein